MNHITHASSAPTPPYRLVLAGGCGGIGRALAQQALQLGFQVAVLDLAVSIDKHPVAGAHHFALDAKVAASVDTAMQQAADKLGGIDGCVNLVGYVSDATPLAKTSTEVWQEVLHGNLDAAFFISRAALPFLLQSNQASLVHIASGLGAWARPMYGAYGPAKAGMILLMQELALENAPTVRVNAVAPGAVDTAFLRGGTGRSDEQAPSRVDAKQFAQLVPLGRIADASDVVGPVLFLLSKASSYMTGQTLFVNGGAYMP